MKTTQRTIIACVAMMTLSCLTASGGTFRGIERNQGNNLLDSDVLNRLTDLNEPYYIDVLDGFNRNGTLQGSDADGLQIGFVPPTAGVPSGPLTGNAADAHGRWSTLQGELVTSSAIDGYVSSQSGPALASTPWRVEPFLGDYYYLDMTARVAAGEKVSLGYMGDIDTHGTANGLQGLFGQLALSVERGTGAQQNQLSWVVSWAEGNTVRSLNSNVTVADGEEVNLQLGWLDGQASGDLFDAWIGTDAGNTRLVAGSMALPIDVFSVGFSVSGNESQIGGFTAAVPEPTAGVMALLGMLAIITSRKRS